MPSTNTQAFDTVAIQNIDTEDFVFEYDRSRGNYPYVIPAGQVKRFPRFLAEHAVKHLINKILNKREERTDNMILRQSLAEQIVVGEEVLQQPPKKTEAEILKEQVDKLNKPSELESVLNKQRKEEKIETPPPVKETPHPEPEEKFEGLDETKPKEEPEKEPFEKEVKEESKEEVKRMPTRNEIYAYAINKMGITIDEKAQKKFDKMKVAELLVELADPRESLV